MSKTNQPTNYSEYVAKAATNLSEDAESYQRRFGIPSDPLARSLLQRATAMGTEDEPTFRYVNGNKIIAKDLNRTPLPRRRV